MPIKYYEDSVGSYWEKDQRLRSFALVIDKFQHSSTPQAAVKTLTIIFKSISETKYDEDFLEKLLALEISEF